MKLKSLFLLAAVVGVALATWAINRGNSTSEFGGRDPYLKTEVPEQYRDTVAKGLEYLVKHQGKDAHWEGNDGKHPVAMTGFVGIALLMERTELKAGDRKGKHTANINKAVDWLIQQAGANRDGLIYSGHASETDRYMEGHGLATMFLAGVLEDGVDLDQPRRQKLTEVVTAAVKYIGKAQSSQGGWYRTSKAEGHDFDSIRPTVIQVQALQAAENAGIAAAGRAMADAQEYLRMKVDALPASSKHRAFDIAAAFAGRCSNSAHKGDRIDEVGKKWYLQLQQLVPVGRKIQLGTDDLTHYYHAQGLFLHADSAWTEYRHATFDHLKAAQQKDGSWPSSNGFSVGPVYATALWCSVLQLDNDHYPGMRRPPRIVK